MRRGVVSERYDGRVASGALKDDSAQRQALQELDALAQSLGAKTGDWVGWARDLLGRKATGGPDGGLYLVGKVGRGKSMLMDLFFEAAPVKRKRRIHFNAFMQDVHGRLHELRRRHAEPDVVAPLARDISGEVGLLCLDELQVRDIADAMLLGRLFEALLDQGVIVVVTSNTEPDRLYEDGLNRALFLPFIALIKARLRIVRLSGPLDHRLTRIAGRKTYVWPLTPEADRHVASLWRELTDSDTGAASEIAFKGRSLKVRQSARGVARFAFAELCEAPLGPADYLAIAENFDTVIIEGVPKLARARRDIARRFITLIDILYDAGARLVVSAAASPDELGADLDDFARTASRLHEMQRPDFALRRALT